jgi:hypothetical protein
MNDTAIDDVVVEANATETTAGFRRQRFVLPGKKLQALWNEHFDGVTDTIRNLPDYAENKPQLLDFIYDRVDVEALGLERIDRFGTFDATRLDNRRYDRAQDTYWHDYCIEFHERL